MGMSVIYGDICEAQCDAIVNAANGIGFMGGPLGRMIKFSCVSENIHYETNGKVEKEAVKRCLNHFLIGYMPGNVYVTGGYDLKCKYIIHAVTMWFPGTFSSMKILRKLLPKIVIQARALNISSVAIPLLGTGVGHLKPDKVFDEYKNFFESVRDIDVFVYLLKK